MSKQQKSETKDHIWLKILSQMVSKIGLAGTITLLLFTLLFEWGTIDQKREAIDLFILQKWAFNFNQGLAITLLFSIALLVQRYYYSNTIQELELEVDRLGGNKSSKQANKLNTELNSSKKKKPRKEISQ